MPGDVVNAQVLESKKNLTRVKVMEVMQASEFRNSNPELIQAAATGANWAHLTYDYQLQAKRENVISALV